MTNQELAQEINTRIGESPIPFDSVYSIALQIYRELGGTDNQFDSVYSILMEILPMASETAHVINDNVVALDKTWSSSKIDSELEALAGTANSDIEGKETEDFRFVTELPVSGEEGEQVIIKGDNEDTLYKFVSGEWTVQAPDATKLYFDTDNEVLYSYASVEHQFVRISMVNTIVVGSNLNTNADLKALKTVGVYSVVQRLHNATKGDYVKNWTLYVESIDYEEYDRSDSVYQKLVSNYTIQKRTWSATRATNDGWSNFSTYYTGEIKDTTTSKYYTWSSNKLTTELGAKQGTLTAGQNISIDSANTISAEGYIFDKTKHAFRTDADTINGSGANVATGINSFSCGDKSTASGDYGSFAAGSETVASGWCSFAEGNRTTASGDDSHAEGYETQATGDYGSHAEGCRTIASGESSHAEGRGNSQHYNTASGDFSHVEGAVTTALNQNEHAEGSCNRSHKNSDTYGDSGNTLHSVGFGTSTSNTKNAHEIMQNGDMYIYGVGGYIGTNTKVQDASIMTVQEVISGINTSVAGKQDTLTAGTNITISGTTISATYETPTTAEIEALFA